MSDVHDLASLVTNVTSTFCGVSFVAGDPQERGESVCHRMLLLPLLGLRRTNLVISFDTSSARALASLLLRRPPSTLVPGQVEEALSSLLKMIAVQIANATGEGLTLGEVRPVTLLDLAAEGAPEIKETVLLRSEAGFDIRVWLYQYVAGSDPGMDQGEDRPSPRTRLAQLVKRIVRR